MLKVRLIPCVITKNELVVQSFNFKKYLPIGSLKTAIEFFVNWDVDEILIIDIDASRDGRRPNFDLVSKAARECFVPLTIGGGINSISDVRELLNAGADKVCLNNVVYRNPRIVTEISDIFGSQCVTISIDAIETPLGYQVYDYLNRTILPISPSALAEKMEDLGAGEIFLNSVDRDGCRSGYDLALLKSVSGQVNLPVIACGGVGKFLHLADGVLSGGCQAVSASNIFQHTEHSTIAAKSQLLRSGVDVRLSSNVKYENFKFDVMGRPY